MDAAALLLSHGADVNAVADNGDTSANWAAGSNHAEMLRMLLRAGARTDVQNSGARVLLWPGPLLLWLQTSACCLFACRPAPQEGRLFACAPGPHQILRRPPL